MYYCFSLGEYYSIFYSQVTDSFTDGDFTTNPVWAGTDADPLQLFIAVSSLGTAATTAGILKMKCSYTIVRI